MKQNYYLLVFLLFFLTSLTTFGQSTDNLNQISTSVHSDTLGVLNNTETFDESNDFSPGLGLFALFALGFILICVGAGVVFTILFLLVVFGLVSFGALSTSIIVGLHKKSFLKGFKTFIILTSICCGSLIGGISFWVLNKMAHWWTTQTAILSGATFGILSGLAVGLLAFYVLQRLTTYFKQKLTIDENGIR